jgi:hypothetical protein
MPSINWAKKIAYEGNVSIPGGEKFSYAYDLALFEDLVNSQAMVLLVTVTMDFTFDDYDGLTWGATDKTAFMNGVKTLCEGAWSNKFRIIKAFPVPGLASGFDRTIPNRSGSYSEARVAILVNTSEGSSLWLRGWNINVKKTKSPVRPSVGDKSNVRFESTMLDPNIPDGGTKPRRSIVHEFGHMLGYRDEYPNSERGTDAYVGEVDSIMHVGDTIKERHYVFFADWISNKLCAPWAVEGRRTLQNTPL